MDKQHSTDEQLQQYSRERVVYVVTERVEKARPEKNAEYFLSKLGFVGGISKGILIGMEAADLSQFFYHTGLLEAMVNNHNHLTVLASAGAGAALGYLAGKVLGKGVDYIHGNLSSVARNNRS